MVKFESMVGSFLVFLKHLKFSRLFKLQSWLMVVHKLPVGSVLFLPPRHMCFLGVWSSEDLGDLHKTVSPEDPCPFWKHTCAYLKEHKVFSEALKCVNQAAAGLCVQKCETHEEFDPVLCKYLGVSVCVQISLRAQWQRDGCNSCTVVEKGLIYLC